MVWAPRWLRAPAPAKAEPRVRAQVWPPQREQGPPVPARAAPQVRVSARPRALAPGRAGVVRVLARPRASQLLLEPNLAPEPKPLTRDLQRRFVGFGTGVTKEKAAGEPPPGQRLGQPDLRLDEIQVRGVVKAGGLRVQRLCQTGITVTEDTYGDAGGHVEVAAPVGVIQDAALAAAHDHGRPPVVREQKFFAGGNQVVGKAHGRRPEQYQKLAKTPGSNHKAPRCHTFTVVATEKTAGQALEYSKCKDARFTLSGPLPPVPRSPAR